MVYPRRDVVARGPDCRGVPPKAAALKASGAKEAEGIADVDRPDGGFEFYIHGRWFALKTQRNALGMLLPAVTGSAALRGLSIIET